MPPALVAVEVRAQLQGVGVFNDWLTDVLLVEPLLAHFNYPWTTVSGFP